MRLLMRYSWPGNVQHLQQLLQQVVQHRRGGSIEGKDLPPERTRSAAACSPRWSRWSVTRSRSLADTNGNKVQAARSLGMSRATIYRKIHEIGIIAPA